ncbi:hypothetical protein CYMTET_16126 [Cymbomonas tetramitiformis]|uniref:Pyrroline-5-carboxylate reductase catalytic N-terminal domain-containing protein n=1 Tax=Cymbomonas tetramitiformis TaxID=36881 RepID=A0AAE0GCU1_9CHLO|nr:hypothetical protein CYMTET_16126 [Cymbomonas tetramitiformis]
MADTFGFLGVGTMNGALATGICRLSAQQAQNVKFPLYLSPRSKEKAESLLAKFGPEKIHICESNQDVLDRVSVVFLGLLPSQVRPVFYEEKLQCKSSHFVVNLTSTVKNAELAEIISSCSEASREFALSNVMKAVPLPAVQHLQGTTILCPPNAYDGKISCIFDALGMAVEVEEKQLVAYQAMTAMMGPLYQQAQWHKEWLVENADVSPELAQTFVCGLMNTIMADPNKGETFEQLMEAQTKGGINEQRMNLLSAHKESTKASMDAVYERLNKGNSTPQPRDE